MQEQKSLHLECICPQIGRWNEINIYPTEDGLSIFFKDINERKETEEELHKLSLIAKETTNPVWLMDRERKITWINEAFTRAFGYTPDEAIGRKTKDLLRGPESDMEVVAQLYRAQDEGKEFRGEITSYTKSKEKLFMQVICQPLFDEKGAVSQYFSLQIDLTERKKLDAELKAQQRRINAAVIAAQEGERAQLGQELHDNVNQVLTTVKLYTELCRDGIGQTQEIMNKSVKLLQESISEIRSLSKRLSAPSLGNIRLKDSVKELVDSVAATNKVSITLDTKGIDSTKVDQEVHLGLYRIIQEHLTNILKHADAANVQIRMDATDSELRLEITDDGKGFDTKKKRRGIGISNMITRTEALNGKFDIQSKPNHGCKLLVNLPWRA
jgi:PAS domain S-box-containing protein